MKRCLLAFFAVVVCVSASFADKAPDWTSGQSKQYPGENFIIGVGLAKDLDAARSSARAEISKIFKARIMQSASDSFGEGLVQKGGAAKTAVFYESSQSVTVSTDQEISGVEIKETWFDKRSKTYFALAVLDRRKARAALAAELSDVEESEQAYALAAGRAVSPVQKLRAINSALYLRDIKIR